MNKIISFGLVLGSFPAMAFAATDIGTILVKLISYLNLIVPALITVAVVYFIWGVISFITSDNEEQKKLGRSKIINGLIGLFVIVAFWGIIGVFKNTFEIDSRPEGSIVPCIPSEENNMGKNC